MQIPPYHIETAQADMKTIFPITNISIESFIFRHSFFTTFFLSSVILSQLPMITKLISFFVVLIISISKRQFLSFGRLSV